jgi:GT2 family glycosyltransferase
MDKSMKVAIGSPIKNRGWILPEYLKALNNIEYPNKEYIFLENDSIDISPDILYRYNFNDDYIIKSIKTELNIGEERSKYGANNYSHLADIRNKFLELFLETDAEYLFSIDSDVIVPSNILTELLKYANDNTIIGVAISNIPNKELDGKTPGNFMVINNGIIAHCNNYPSSGIMEVDVIGACYLIPRKAIEDGIRYKSNAQGEDIPWCLQAKSKGYKLLVNFDLACKHKMIKEV